jgi:hypothetical protein
MPYQMREEMGNHAWSPVVVSSHALEGREDACWYLKKPDFLGPLLYVTATKEGGVTRLPFWSFNSNRTAKGYVLFLTRSHFSCCSMNRH